MASSHQTATPGNLISYATQDIVLLPQMLRRISQALALSIAVVSQAPAMANTVGLDADSVDLSQFVITSAPISGSGRSQLQIYEQLSSDRRCFIANDYTVDPQLVNFDFTGICQRYIDSNGYSVRVGNRDLSTVYRLSIRREAGKQVLMAVPTRPDAGPEMQVASTMTDGESFLKLHLDNGWTIKRRSYQGRALGHVYLYRETWPQNDPNQLTSSQKNMEAAASSQPATATIQPQKYNTDPQNTSSIRPLF